VFGEGDVELLVGSDRENLDTGTLTRASKKKLMIDHAGQLGADVPGEEDGSENGEVGLGNEDGGQSGAESETSVVQNKKKKKKKKTNKTKNKKKIIGTKKQEKGRAKRRPCDGDEAAGVTSQDEALEEEDGRSAQGGGEGDGEEEGEGKEEGEEEGEGSSNSSQAVSGGIGQECSENSDSSASGQGSEDATPLSQGENSSTSATHADLALESITKILFNNVRYRAIDRNVPSPSSLEAPC
jgi:hypothetical protein